MLCKRSMIQISTVQIVQYNGFETSINTGIILHLNFSSKLNKETMKVEPLVLNWVGGEESRFQTAHTVTETSHSLSPILQEPLMYSKFSSFCRGRTQPQKEKRLTPEYAVSQWHGPRQNPHLPVPNLMFFAFSLSLLKLTWKISRDKGSNSGARREGDIFKTKHQSTDF